MSRYLPCGDAWMSMQRPPIHTRGPAMAGGEFFANGFDSCRTGRMVAGRDKDILVILADEDPMHAGEAAGTAAKNRDSRHEVSQHQSRAKVSAGVVSASSGRIASRNRLTGSVRSPPVQARGERNGGKNRAVTRSTFLHH